MVYKVGNINYAITAILITNVIAVIYALAPGVAFYGLQNRYDGLAALLAFIFLYYMVVMVVKKKNIDGFIFVLIGVGYLAAAYGIVQALRLDPFEGWINLDFTRFPGSTFGRSNFFAAYLLVVVPLIMYCILKYKKWWLYVVLVVVLSAMVLTKTRSALIGLAVSAIWFGWCNRGLIRWKPVIVVLIMVVVLNLVMADSPVKRLFRLEENKSRIEMYAVGWEAIKDRLWTGYGQDNLYFVYTQYYFEVYGDLPVEHQDKFHNEWLDIWVDTGVLGLLAWLFFYAVYFRLTWRHRFDMRTTALSSSVLGYVVNNQFSFGMTPNVLVFWYLIALTIVSVREA